MNLYRWISQTMNLIKMNCQLNFLSWSIRLNSKDSHNHAQLLCILICRQQPITDWCRCVCFSSSLWLSRNYANVPLSLRDTGTQGVLYVHFRNVTCSNLHTAHLCTCFCEVTPLVRVTGEALCVGEIGSHAHIPIIVLYIKCNLIFI